MPPHRLVPPINAKPAAPSRDRLAAQSAPLPEPVVPPSSAGLSRFDIAVARAQARYTAEQWALLEPSSRTASIYAELRHLDVTGGSGRLAAE